MVPLNTIRKIYPLNGNVYKIHNTITFCQTTKLWKWPPGLYTLETNWSSLIYWNHSFFSQNLTVQILNHFYMYIVSKRNRKIVINPKIPKIKLLSPANNPMHFFSFFSPNISSSEYMPTEQLLNFLYPKIREINIKRQQKQVRDPFYKPTIKALWKYKLIGFTLRFYSIHFCDIYFKQ